MGNHQLGRQVMRVAEALWDQREKTGLTALQILDIAAGEDIRGTDADFSDKTETFRAILEAAFSEKSPEWYRVHDEDGDLWYDEIYMKFYERYKAKRG